MLLLMTRTGERMLGRGRETVRAVAGAGLAVVESEARTGLTEAGR